MAGMDPVEVLRRLGGVATRGEILGPADGSGPRRPALEAAVRAGRVVRLRHNCYALAGLDEAKQRARTLGGVVSHLSAAQHWGWKVKHPPLRPCVTLPRSARKPVADVELHWQDLTEAQVVDHVTCRVTTVTACARAYARDVALCVADSALREGMVTQDDLLIAAEQSPRTGRRRALWVAENADGRADNPFESTLRDIALHVPGLHVVAQGSVDGVGRVDLLDRTLGIVVEAESYEWHATRDQLRRDVKRYTTCARCGFVVVRFTWDEVMFDADYVRAALADVVGWRQRQAVRETG
jgi:very-short-patch-repair endonuclease